MRRCKLGDVGTITNGDIMPVEDGIYPVYGGNGIVRYASHYNDEGKSIAIGRVGAQCGTVYYCSEKSWITDNCLSFHPNQHYHPYYVYYLLKFIDLNKFHIGSAQPLITQSIISNLEIDVITQKDIQTKIATTLYSIDKKISLNNHVNATLEAMAKTLYDYWFVQFDFPDEKGRPYKTSGGKMVYNEELGREIPAGWEAGNLNVIAEYINGLACQRFRPQENENALPVVKIREIHEGIQADTERVSVNIPEENIIEDGDILFSWSATLEVNYWIGGKAGLNQHIFKVQPKEGFNREYVYHQLREYVINFVKIAEARKTTMGHITQDHLNFSRIPIPPRPVLSSFQTQMRPLHEKMIQSKKENHRLAALRDWLLPMLMNGQVGFRKGLNV